MKCYVFVHSHLSSIQKGIQAAHVVAQLVLTPNGRKWAYSDEPTLYILEGGNTKKLDDKTQKLSNTEYSYAVFNEDYDTLSEMTTAAGFIFDDKQRNFTERTLMTMVENGELAK